MSFNKIKPQSPKEK